MLHSIFYSDRYSAVEVECTCALYPTNNIATISNQFDTRCLQHSRLHGHYFEDSKYSGPLFMMYCTRSFTAPCRRGTFDDLVMIVYNTLSRIANIDLSLVAKFEQSRSLSVHGSTLCAYDQRATGWHIVRKGKRTQNYFSKYWPSPSLANSFMTFAMHLKKKIPQYLHLSDHQTSIFHRLKIVRPVSDLQLKSQSLSLLIIRDDSFNSGRSVHCFYGKVQIQKNKSRVTH